MTRSHFSFLYLIFHFAFIFNAQDSAAAMPDNVRHAIQAKCVSCHMSSQKARAAFPLDERTANDKITDALLFKHKGRILEAIDFGMMPPPYADRPLSPAVKSPTGELLQQGEASLIYDYVKGLSKPAEESPPKTGNRKVAKDQPDLTPLPKSADAGSCEVVEDHNKLAADDLTKVAAKDRKFMRYISLGNTWFGNDKDKDMLRQAINKLINSVSDKKALAKALQVDKKGLLFRIDLRQYGLEKSAGRLDQALQPKPAEQLQSGYKQLAKLAGTSAPLYRADRFIDKVSKPPLYHDIQNMPKTVQAFNDRYVGDKDKNPVYAALKESGVSSSSRGYSCRDGKFGLCCESYDYLGRKDGGNGGSNLFTNPGTTFANGGEFVCTGSNGLPKFFISAATNGGRQKLSQQERIDVAPTEVVKTHFTVGGKVTNGRTCFSCHHNTFVPSGTDFVPSFISKLPPAGRDQATKLFRQGELEQRIKDANAKGRNALKEIGVTSDTDPIQSVIARFEKNLTADQLSCELGTTENNLKFEIRGDSSLAKGRALLNGGNIRRSFAEEVSQNFTPAALPKRTISTEVRTATR